MNRLRPDATSGAPDLRTASGSPPVVAVPRQSAPTIDMLGFRFTTVTPAGAVHTVLQDAVASPQRGRAPHVHLVNAYTLALADRDPSLATVLQRGLNLVDGTPLAWLAAASGASRQSRRACRGPQFFHDVLDAGRKLGTRHYLLGGSPQTLDLLQRRIALDHPTAQVVGVCSPPFRDLDNDEKDAIFEEIRTAKPDIVWVGLGTPKQDFWSREIADRLAITAVAVGAAFDFAAGLKSEAPSWMRGSGLEWIYRLATEPRRLWRRYLFGNARFLCLAVRQLTTRTSDSAETSRGTTR